MDMGMGMDPMMGGMDGGMAGMGGGMPGGGGRGNDCPCDPFSNQRKNKFTVEHTVSLLLYVAACVCIFVPTANIQYALDPGILALWMLTFLAGLQSGLLGVSLTLYERSRPIKNLAGESITAFWFWATLVGVVLPIALIVIIYQTAIGGGGSSYAMGASIQTAGCVSAMVGCGSELWVHRAENPAVGRGGQGGGNMGMQQGMGMDMGGMGGGMGMSGY